MTTNKTKRRKLKVGYEPDVPACDRCIHFRGQYMQLQNSTPQWHQHRCKLHEFNVSARGCCNDWRHKRSGETLESAPNQEPASSDQQGART